MAIGRRLIKDFAKLARPLTVLDKDTCFLWTDACQKAFDEPKAKLTNTDVMGYTLNKYGKFLLDADASRVGIVEILQQKQSDRERVIVYWSRFP